MPSLVLVLGAVLTLGGAALLVLAYREGAAGRREQERRMFWTAVGVFAACSLMFVLATAMGVRP